MKAIVLAGERPGGSPLASATDVPAAILASVAGRPSICRVIDTLRATDAIEGGLVVGPDAQVCRESAVLDNLFEQGDYRWLEPECGPAESTIRALDTLDNYPVLLTTGDHALLTPATVEQFLAAAVARDAGAVVGLAPHERVMLRFPGSRRTRLSFLEGNWCGTNLFLLRNREALGAIRFWSTVQRDRKRPWRIARRLGAGNLLRYLIGRLPMAAAFAALSRAAGCSVAWVEVEDAAAAVDIDSIEDLALAEKVLAC